MSMFGLISFVCLTVAGCFWLYSHERRVSFLIIRLMLLLLCLLCCYFDFL